MSGADWAIIAVVAVLFVLSIFFASAETAFVRMSRIRAIALEEEGIKRAARLVHMLEHPEQTLNVVLLMVLVAQLTSATLIGVLLANGFVMTRAEARLRAGAVDQWSRMRVLAITSLALWIVITFVGVVLANLA